MPERNELDVLLDDALHTYGEADRGLSERVLRRVVHSVVRRRRHMLAWAIALPLAACVVLALLLPRFVSHTPLTIARLPVEPPAPPAPPQTVPKIELPTAPLEHVRASAPRAARAEAAFARPKLDVFPTPRPLSPQERAFVDFASAAPARDRNAYLEAQKDLDQPIHIAAIHIQPIQAPAEGNE
jgi:hypothetical protein